jgi:hypothetical protein
MAKKKEQIMIREFISQKEIDEVLESAFVEQAEAADELELELSDLAETTTFDADPDGNDPGLISNDDIGALFTSPGAKQVSESPASDDDIGSIVSQSDIDALLSGGLDAAAPSVSAQSELEPDSGELESDSGGMISQGDIDALLKGAGPADQAPEAAGGDGTMVSQADIDALLSGAESTSEDASDSGLVSQSDIDALLGGAAKKAPEGEDTFEPQERNENGDVISQSDIDALLKGAMASEEAGAVDGGDISEGVVSQSDIDSLLNDSLSTKPLEDKEPEPEPEPVILAQNLEETEVPISEASVLPPRWYTRKLYQVGAVAALVLIISSTVFFFSPRSRNTVPKAVVLTFPIQKPESQTVTARVLGNTTVTMPGFLVLAPAGNSDITCLTADLQFEFSDTTTVRMIKDNEGFVRNIIYGVINDALLSSDKKAIDKKDLTSAVHEALGRVIPREKIRSVSFGKFEII